MSEALKLGGEPDSSPRIRRLNRVPIVVAIVLVVAFFGIIIYGLSSRGLRFGGDELTTTPGSAPASRFGDQLTQGVPDGIIGEPAPIILQPTPAPPAEGTPESDPRTEDPVVSPTPRGGLEAEEAWRARLEREQDEVFEVTLASRRSARNNVRKSTRTAARCALETLRHSQELAEGCKTAAQCLVDNPAEFCLA